MNKAEKSQKITLIFNVILFVYIGCAFFAEYLFKPETPARVPWEILFENSPIMSIVVALIFALALIMAGSYLLRLFWNRFIADVFKVRDITYNEAIAILLIAGVIF